VKQLAERIEALPARQERNGVVYTKRWVVELILDLVGYTPERDLIALVIVEPSVGDGSFMVPIVERLLESIKRHGHPLERAINAIAGYELDAASVERCRTNLMMVLEAHDIDEELAGRLVKSWVRQADYLIDRHGMPRADMVVGNPPYIRLEDVPAERATLYRSRYATMIGRADVYVAFFEAALTQLNPEGLCAFICADRWMLNQYGAYLRQLVTAKFAVDTVIELHSAEAFLTEVSAYPAITVIRHGSQASALVARIGADAESLGGSGIREFLDYAATVMGTTTNGHGLRAASIDHWFTGNEPWPCYNPERLALLKRLEAEFYPLESKGTGTRAGIGVATGADSIFVTKEADVVEPERMLPLALAKDIRSGHLQWSGHHLVSPWDRRGLVQLEHFPRLRDYLASHEAALRTRHVGKKNRDTWYRTIDRVDPQLLGKTKLYIADIKERLNPVLDRGETYPHHNLYFVQSEGWDHEVLGGLLLSDVAQFFIECYGVRMRGGYLRFQAQYLRRIRLPRPVDINPTQGAALKRAFADRDQRTATEIALTLYGISHIPKDDYQGG
jgi:adenine-specific DNA-methyltransferase